MPASNHLARAGQLVASSIDQHHPTPEQLGQCRGDRIAIPTRQDNLREPVMCRGRMFDTGMCYR